MTYTPLNIIFENENLVAINKPHGLLVHKTKMAKDAAQFALQMVRNQINQHVYPVHRLDRKTSGVLLFAKNKLSNSEIQNLFAQREVGKTYHAIVRGFTVESDTIDYNLLQGNTEKEAITHFKTIEKFEIDIPDRNFTTSRYSLIEIQPETGRFHQIRKHMAHIFHPIIGDRPHGCNKQNRLWKDKLNMTTMLLHASALRFNYQNVHYTIQAERSTEFQNVLNILKSRNVTCLIN